jgi:virginiamycin A acetyltransferase
LIHRIPRSAAHDRNLGGSYFKFIMNGANHQMDGISTFPFFIFGNGWEEARPAESELPFKGDTIIGNDVWIGYDSLIMPGVKIGDGAIVAARSVVTADVPPYAIAGGNPARVVRQRFDADSVRRLQAIAWWDRPTTWISRHLNQIRGGDIDALEAAAADLRPSR